MYALEDIKKTIAPCLSDFNEAYTRIVKSEVSLLNEITSYVKLTSGKQIRPVFTYLSALLCGEATNQTTRVALSIELLHSSTLLHDDVVDNSHVRRGKATVNVKWNNKLAILSGDYILSLVLGLLSRKEDVPVLTLLSKVAMELSEGEVLQQEKSMEYNYSEDYYYQIIKKKTASLLSACFEGGAISVGAGEKQVALLKEIGESVGIAFQIKDDILDYMTDAQTGKMFGNDIRERKFTLPLIAYMNGISQHEKEVILDIFKLDTISEEQVKDIVEKVNYSKGIEYANQCMEKYIENALLRLDEFEDSEIKKTLRNAISYVIDREL